MILIFLLIKFGQYFYLKPVVPTCPPLTAPANGGIDCSLGGNEQADPGDTCTFTCDDGYQISGSTRRTCGDDGNWSGMNPTCMEGTYEELVACNS